MKGPQRDVVQVADRRGDEVKRSHRQPRSALASPVARVAEIAVNRARGEFGDHGKTTLVLVLTDPAHDLGDECLVESLPLQFVDRVAALDEVVEQLIDHAVLETELRLVGLPGPYVRRRSLLHYGSRDAERVGQLP